MPDSTNANSLVNRVTRAIFRSGPLLQAPNEAEDQARAAIREVAAWLREQDPEPGPVGRLLGQISTPCTVMADELERKASL